jgi:protein-S-isoprenylcysteine O-methyltransferase Ste14
MGKLHQMVSFKGLAHSAALLRNKLGMPFSLAKLILLFTVSMSLSASAMAQSAYAAISAARQWLTLADADQAGQMWEHLDRLHRRHALVGRGPVGYEYEYESIETAAK